MIESNAERYIISNYQRCFIDNFIVANPCIMQNVFLICNSKSISRWNNAK